MSLATLPRNRQPIRAAIYCRISLAAHGDDVKVKTQEKRCRKLAKRLGWDVVAVYSDNNKSAWQRNRKREDWDEMLRAIERGEVNAVIIYHGDRLIRQPWDLETLLSLAEGRGIHLASPSGTRNLDDADDRYRLRQDVAKACNESDTISRRTRITHAEHAEAGKMRKNRSRLFGYKRSKKIHEEEAGHYRKAVARILAGESMSSVVRGWNTDGVTTTEGNRWTVNALRVVLRNPRHAGLSTYRGEIVGVGRWKPLIDRDTWEALQAALGAISRQHGQPNHSTASKYLLTNIAFHELCGGGMVPHYYGGGKKQLNYRCGKAECPKSLSRNMAYVDEFVIGTVLGRLADARLWAVLEEPVPEDNAGAELAALERKRRDTVETFENSETMTPAALAKTLKRIDERIEAIRARIAARHKVHVLSGCREMTRGQWDALPLDRRRALVRALVTVEILPAKRGPGFDPGSVRVLPVEVRRAEGVGGSGEGSSAAGLPV